LLFNSIAYLAFLVGVAVVSFATPARWRWLFLLLASYGFYMCWQPAYVLILVTCTWLNYLAARGMEASASPGARRAWLVAGLAGSFGLLFVFKYLGFFTRMTGAGPVTDLVLPVGISFYTFQSAGYTIDVFWQRRPAEKHLGLFALYVSFFPLLLAGPIEKSTRFLPQLREDRPFTYDQAMSGARLILWGLFQKVVVADNIGRFVDAVFRDVGAYWGTPLLLASVLFAIQVYADFSGYSNVAVGSARLLGFELTRNFDAPYLATSLTDFWRRWHISLYSWFSDYVYGPISIQLRRWPKLAAPLGVIVTFALSGLWHGAAWTFVTWGTLHGLALALLAVTRGARRPVLRRIPPLVQNTVGWALTFAFVVFASVFFRADSMTDALYVCTAAWRIDTAHLVGVPVVSRASFALYLFLAASVFAADAVLARAGRPERRLPGPANVAVLAALVVCLYVLGVFEDQKFIYFQF
jgi:alginate O-acetyltransferase complex protein AlgI